MLDLVGNPEDRFSCVTAQIMATLMNRLLGCYEKESLRQSLIVSFSS